MKALGIATCPQTAEIIQPHCVVPILIDPRLKEGENEAYYDSFQWQKRCIDQKVWNDNNR